MVDAESFIDEKIAEIGERRRWPTRRSATSSRRSTSTPD